MGIDLVIQNGTFHLAKTKGLKEFQRYRYSETRYYRTDESR